MGWNSFLDMSPKIVDPQTQHQVSACGDPHTDQFKHKLVLNCSNSKQKTVSDLSWVNTLVPGSTGILFRDCLHLPQLFCTNDLYIHHNELNQFVWTAQCPERKFPEDVGAQLRNYKKTSLNVPGTSHAAMSLVIYKAKFFNNILKTASCRTHFLKIRFQLTAWA